MKHIHLATCLSTQDELLNQVKNHQIDFPALISCEAQTHGHGQYGRIWKADTGSLCFSCLLKPHEILTLSTINIAVLLCLYFEKNFQKKIFLKWPNDLMNENAEKLGGILTQKVDHFLIVGIGLNLFGITETINNVKANSIFEDTLDLNKEKLSKDIYEFLINTKITNIQELWTQRCIHLNKNIVWDSHKSGKFLGINQDGSAQILSDNSIQNIYSASLQIT